MRQRLKTLARAEAGVSLPEILIIVAMVSVLFGITIIAFQAAATSIQGDANLRIVEWQMKYAREVAINQRRDIEVAFTPPNRIQVIRQDLPNGTTLLSSAILESNTTFVRFGTVPDTPDGFATGGALDFGGAANVYFTADGMFTDAAGNPVNGTIFIGQVSKPLTARALTVFGTTARIRTYRWNGGAWGF